MTNQFIVVGRVVNFKEMEEGILVVLNVMSSDENNSTPIQISFNLFRSLADNFRDHVHIGDLVAIKGRIGNAPGTTKMLLEVERLSYLSSMKGGE